MKYILYKTMLKLKYNIKKYAPLILELSIGICIIVVSLNYTFSSNERKSILKSQQYSYSTFDLNIMMDSSHTSVGSAFTYEDFLYLKDRYDNDINMVYVLCCYLHYLDTLSMSMSMYYIMYVSEDFFEIYGNTSEYNDGYCYMGDNIVNLVNKGNEIKSESPVFYIQNTEIVKIYDNEVSAVPLSNIWNGSEYITINILFTDISVEDCIFVPMKYCEDAISSDAANTLLRIQIHGQENIYGVASEIKDYLYNVHGGGYIYEILNTMSRYNSIDSYVTNTINTLTYCAWTAILIMLFGFTGVIYMMTGKRRREIAVSIVLGAQKKAIVLETVFEIFAICFTGMVIGCILGIIITYNLPMNALYEVKLYKEVIAVVFAVVSVMTAVISGFSLIEIKTVSPVIILKDL